MSLTAWIYGVQTEFVKRHLMFVPHENMSAREQALSPLWLKTTTQGCFLNASRVKCQRAFQITEKACLAVNLTAWIYGGQMMFVKRHLMFVPHENIP